MHVILQIRERAANPINVIPIRSTTSASNPQTYSWMAKSLVGDDSDTKERSDRS
jgi:hypothetical protein